MNEKVICAAIFVFFLASCAAARHSDISIAYTPSDIVRNSHRLEGHQVRVVGYLVLSQESGALWDSQQNVEDVYNRHPSGGDPIWNHCMSAYYDFSIANEVEAASRTRVDVIGTISVSRESDEAVDLWSCNDVHITIHQLR